ncbi:hypothetical protein MY1884_000515 [Beauveria asiatica]|uniref:Ubiquitin-like domain-containing protein n=1 Tax=Beauveria asiatica TaxID=1069075 RepID=A0AAW0RST9_9HYPO
MRRSTSVAHYSSGEPSPQFTPAYPAYDDDFSQDGHGYITHGDEENWGDEDDYSESEQSVFHAGLPAAPRAHPSRLPLRPAPLPHQQHYRPARRAPDPAPTLDPQEEYGAYGHGAYPGGQYGRGGYPRSASQHPQAYAAYFPPGQVVGYAGGNPFSPAGSGYSSPATYPHGQVPAMYGNEMAPYYHQGHYYPQQPQFQMAPHAMQLDVPAAPAAPAAPPGPSPREQELADKVAQFEREKQKQELAEREKEMQAEAHRKAAEESRKIMEQMENLKKQNEIELQRAKEEAARATRDGIAAEAAAAAERAKVQAEAVKQAEERVKVMFEQQKRAEEARLKKEAEDKARIEEEHKRRVEAALRADADAKAAAAKAAAEEAAKLNAIREEAKRKADAEFAAKIQADKDAAAKKAEAEALAKAEKEAFKKKVEADTQAAMEAKAKTDRGPFLQFKDALNRKYSFPYRLCTTWPNMEELIKQAFDNVEELEYQVHEGWYDLVGPNQEIILPSVWEKVIEPEWSITMFMWPLERIQRHARLPPHMAAAMARGRGGMGAPPMPPMPPTMSGGRGGVPPPPEAWAQPRPPPMPQGIHVVREPKKEKKKKQAPPAFVGFFGGKPIKKK